MKKLQILILLLLSSLSFTYGQNQLSIQNPGFEDSNTAWKISGNGKISFDASVVKSGSRSIVIEHDQENKTVLTSSEVLLKVGHIYRLSVWAKTESVL